MARNNKDIIRGMGFIPMEWMKKIIGKAGVSAKITDFGYIYLPDSGALLEFQLDNGDIIRIPFSNDEIDSPDLESIVKEKRKELIEQIKAKYKD